MKIKLRRLTMIFGILAGIMGALVPLVGIFISGSIGIVLLKSVFQLHWLNLGCLLSLFLGLHSLRYYNNNNV
ncbi:hypothetical protein, partial [Vallitalea maricola]|uniref:hypothetical protein n=1 Tax=Vallitalea maricola TaxID=3074433 RepID=UPI0030DD8744